MKHYKTSKLLSNSTALKFVTRKRFKVNDLLGGQYSASKNVKFKTPVLRSDFRDYSDMYIVAKGKIIVTDTANTNRRNKKLTFKNDAPFRS